MGLKTIFIQTIVTTIKRDGMNSMKLNEQRRLKRKGVYKISYKNSVKTYMGQTHRRFSTRRDEHKLYLVTNKTSSLAQHGIQTEHKVLHSENYLPITLTREISSASKRKRRQRSTFNNMETCAS